MCDPERKWERVPAVPKLVLAVTVALPSSERASGGEPRTKGDGRGSGGS